MDKDQISQDEISTFLNQTSGKSGQAQKQKSQNTGKSESFDSQGLSEPLLSQDEIDALLNAIPSIQGSASASANLISPQHKEVNVEKYDFTMPSRLSKDHLRSLQALHESYARTMSSALSISLRASVEIECTHIEQLNYGEYLSSLFDPTCIGVFSLKPLRGIGMLEISMPLVFPIIDKLLGGAGIPKVYDRTLTVIEENLIKSVMERSLKILQDSWQRSIEINIQLERLESNPQFIQAAASGDPVILILLDVRLDNVHSIISLCFPFLTIQQALANLKREEIPALIDQEAMESCKEMIHTHVESLYLPLSARYASSPITLGELLEVEKGDILKLQNAKKDEVHIFVSGQRKFSGKPGMINGRRAIQISDIEI